MQTIIDQADYEVDLLVDEANEPAIKLYKSLGFQFPDAPKDHALRLRLCLLLAKSSLSI